MFLLASVLLAVRSFIKGPKFCYDFLLSLILIMFYVRVLQYSILLQCILEASAIIIIILILIIILLADFPIIIINYCIIVGPIVLEPNILLNCPVHKYY